MSRYLYPALPLLVTLLAACSAVGPDYRVPDQAVVRQAAAQAPFDTLGNPEVEQTPLPDGWWQLYDDPLLD
ncbi:MAG TPA: RND transporter, partial [Pseudomonas sp.]|nr:RND transporter [Pseudomonas sp.]